MVNIFKIEEEIQIWFFRKIWGYEYPSKLLRKSWAGRFWNCCHLALSAPNSLFFLRNIITNYKKSKHLSVSLPLKKWVNMRKKRCGSWASPSPLVLIYLFQKKFNGYLFFMFCCIFFYIFLRLCRKLANFSSKIFT